MKCLNSAKMKTGSLREAIWRERENGTVRWPDPAVNKEVERRGARGQREINDIQTEHILSNRSAISNASDQISPAIGKESRENRAEQKRKALEAGSCQGRQKHKESKWGEMRGEFRSEAQANSKNRANSLMRQKESRDGDKNSQN